MGTSRLRWLLVVAAATATATFSAAGPPSANARSARVSHPSAPVSASRIVFAANRLPQWYGEIYRVSPDGQRLDLSNSPAPDIAPAVSPDGRWVAFLSGRGGEWAFYVVGTDGQDLHRVSAPLLALVPNEGAGANIAWAPNSRDLAAVLSATKSVIYLGNRQSGLHAIASSTSSNGGPEWSPDGRLLAYSTSDTLVYVVSASGKRLWSVVGYIGANAWSATDRLAAPSNGYKSDTINIYNSRGRKLTSVRGSSPAWSPGGTLLASVSPYAVQFRSNGTGAPVFSFAVRRASSLQWISTTKLRFANANGWIGVDVARHDTWNAIDPATPYNSAVSPSGRVLAEEVGSNNISNLVLSSPGPASSTTLAAGPWCPDEADFAGLAFIPRNLGVIYQTDCIVPPADIYSINPDGSGLMQITNTPEHEMSPSLSPDGESVVYSQQIANGKCEGCPQTLWRISVTGGTPQQLTSHTDQDTSPYDMNPTWSPDGGEIAYQSSGASAPPRLLVIPATGGTARNLNIKGAALPVWGKQLIAYADWSIAHLVVKTLDPATGVVTTVATGGNTDVQALAWSNSGRLAYTYLDQHTAHTLLAIVGSKAKPLDLSAHLPPQARVAGLAWSPDGTRFAFAATDINDNGEIYTIGTDGSDLHQLTTNIGALHDAGYESTLSWR